MQQQQRLVAPSSAPAYAPSPSRGPSSEKKEKKDEDKPVPDVVRNLIVQQKFGGNWTIDSLVSSLFIKICFNILF